MKAKMLVAILACAAGLGLPALADLPVNGQTYKEIKVDLDKDGHQERVFLEAYNCGEYQFFGQLKVADDQGNIIWHGPRPTDPADPAMFGGFDYGVADMEAIFDVFGDGAKCIIGSMPQSDVRPQVWRVWKWDGKKFVRKFAKCLVEKPANSGHYLWVEAPYDYGRDRWISRFQVNENGRIIADITDYTDPTKCKWGQAFVAPYANGKGMHIVKWIQSPKF
ncbi:MAG: hypothetical protein K6G50_01385 [bacterium]|nr:hypothetical protein [bacterium]